MQASAARYEPDAPRERRALRSRVNQMQRAIAAIELSVDSLSPRDRVVVLHTVLKDAVAEMAERTRAQLEPPIAESVASLIVALAGLYEARAYLADEETEPGRRQAYQEAAQEARALAAKLR